eukprot:TRINITY_DN6280_c0_g2_i2.p1 TRINITY_DN6280_c0_g2~~TRINITY_DN6280_c0_g2_i2.p1  ORF type:complete len:168 (+),score=20.37 TRINITY_DN6280_c0_g2_i2:248-751(+)
MNLSQQPEFRADKIDLCVFFNTNIPTIIDKMRWLSQSNVLPTVCLVVFPAVLDGFHVKQALDKRIHWVSSVGSLFCKSNESLFLFVVGFADPEVQKTLQGSLFVVKADEVSGLEQLILMCCPDDGVLLNACEANSINSACLKTKIRTLSSLPVFELGDVPRDMVTMD